MPSPFPGMDPYLEGREWVSVHTELCTEYARQLAPHLRPKYTVRTTRRYWNEMPAGAGGVCPTGLEAPPPLQQVAVMAAHTPYVTIEIRDVQLRSLVTVIDLLAPTNKRGIGRRDYLERRQRILDSRTHLVELDLLRKGTRLPTAQLLPDAPYFVFLSRYEQRPECEVLPISLHMPLPTIPIPLLAGDPDVLLGLQQALDTVYDALGYDLSVDYSRPPEVLLEGEEIAWAATVLRENQAKDAEKEKESRIDDPRR